MSNPFSVGWDHGPNVVRFRNIWERIDGQWMTAECVGCGAKVVGMGFMQNHQCPPAANPPYPPNGYRSFVPELMLSETVGTHPGSEPEPVPEVDVGDPEDDEPTDIEDIEPLPPAAGWM